MRRQLSIFLFYFRLNVQSLMGKNKILSKTPAFSIHRLGNVAPFSQIMISLKLTQIHSLVVWPWTYKRVFQLQPDISKSIGNDTSADRIQITPHLKISLLKNPAAKVFVGN
ncbi:MAG: hypothetical protein AAGF96_12700 [Bacteroidota bacterium]